MIKKQIDIQQRAYDDRFIVWEQMWPYSVFGYTDKERDVPIDFGVQINSKNIDLYHRTQRNKQTQYMLAHQEDIKELAGKVDLVNKKIRQFDCG